MFELPPVQLSATLGSGSGQWVAAVIADFGLIGVILAVVRLRPVSVHWLVGPYISAAYCFTASTPLAKLAAAIARAFSETFSGMRPVDVPAFIGAELVGAALAVTVFCWNLKKD